MKKISFVKSAFIALSLCMGALACSGSSLIQNAGGRESLSLDGEWKIIIDPYENGYLDYRLKPYDTGYGLDRDYTDRTKLQEYEFELDRGLQVPGDWNTQREDLYYYEGTVWYRKRFDYVPKTGKRYFLHFSGANLGGCV